MTSSYGCPAKVGRSPSGHGSVDLATQPDFTVAVLRKHPSLLLIGVDLKTDKMPVMSAEEPRLMTTDDLVHMMETGSPRG